MTTPRVSVCIPVHNGAAFIAETIRSVLEQGFTDFELVICDNASSDGTPEVCGRFDEPRIRYTRFDELVPQGANWNRCVRLATAPYIILLHADDAVQPDFLRQTTSILDTNEDVQMVHCSVQHIDVTGTPISMQRLYDSDVIDREGQLFMHLLFNGCVVNPAGVLVRRSAFAAVGEFTDAVVWGIDWHMWLRLALRGAVGYISEPLALYREHPASGTSSVLPTARNARDETWVIDDIFQHHASSRPELQSLRSAAMRQVAHRTWCFAEQACRQRKMSSARAGIRNAVRISPRMLLQSRVWALWAATWLGYGFFTDLHRWSRVVRRQTPG